VTGKVLSLLWFERTVSSLPDAIAFYHDALGFRVIDPDIGPWDASDKANPTRSVHAAHLRLGDQDLLLTEFDPPGDPYPANSTSADLWFQHFAIVTQDIAAAYSRLQQYDHTPISRNGPERLPPSTGSVIAYKFRDPDGHPLELIEFPSGTGDARWQANTSALTLGIDHSAISVSDVETSIRFYRDGLGLAVASRQTNQGVEQEKLDALSDDVVDVVSLAPRDSTPHIELLAYRQPAGRHCETSSQPWHMACDRLVLKVDDLGSILKRLKGIALVVCNADDNSGSAMIRDPDGHLLILTEANGPEKNQEKSV
jgi:catechol 2,3-dioxygenase-like lactoylglutathione lyase family enzyme